MSPAALLAQVTSTAWGMAAGRILTVAASAAGIVLVGLLARHRGPLAVALSCGVLAIFPGSLVAAHTVLLEPWLTLFCLIGAVTVLDRDQLAGSGRRLLWGGVAFGFAGAVEVWAIIPVVVVAVLLAPQIRRAALFVAGVAIGFCVPVIPFAATAPRRFYNSFFAAQVFRVVPTRTPVGKRLRLMSGIGQLLHLGTHGDADRRAGHRHLRGGSVHRGLADQRPPADRRWTGSWWRPARWWWWRSSGTPSSSCTSPRSWRRSWACPSAWPPAGWPAPSDRGHRGPRGPAEPRLLGPVGGRGPGGLAVVILAVQQGQSDLSVTPRVTPAALRAVQRIVPPGACVLSDQASFLIAADRFYSTTPGCSEMVDAIGTDYALGHGRDASSGAARYPAVQAAWTGAFRHAQYVWLSLRFNQRRIAWTPALRSYFRDHFTRVYTDGKSDALYARTSRG